MDVELSPVHQGDSTQGLEPSEEARAPVYPESPVNIAAQPEGGEAHHPMLPRITVKPMVLRNTITPEPTEGGSNPRVQQDDPVGTPAPPEKVQALSIYRVPLKSLGYTQANKRR